MIFLLISDSFPPIVNSAAILIEDLACQIEIAGNHTILVIPNNLIFKKTSISFYKNRTILRVRTFNSKSHNLLYRAFSEIFNPFLIILSLKLNKIHNYNGIIWYSPSIFFGFVIQFLKFQKKVKSYLILRDIFPQWALDVGIINKNIAYYLFKFFERLQYCLADRIGIQSTSNIDYFKKNYPEHLRKVEVLQNWMFKREPIKTKINLDETLLRGRFIFVYAGNFGKSQQIENLLNLVSFFRKNKKFGFVFIGAGTEFETIKKVIYYKRIDNLLVLNQVSSYELISLFRQCDMGLITLNLKHSTHNIPGKFISYLFSGLPVVAIVNEGNDLIETINKNNLGVACSSQKIKYLKKYMLKFINTMDKKVLAVRCVAFANKNYSSKKSAKQIIDFFN